MQAFPGENYVSTYQAFGWEYMGRMSSSFIWRKPYETMRPEAFSDTESLEKRGRRFALAVSFSMILFWAGLAVILAALLLDTGSMNFNDWLSLGICAVFIGFFAAYMTYVVGKIYKNRGK